MKLTMYHLEAVRAKLMAVLKPGSFYIAGGAVRDMLLGRDVKDIDVFIKGVPYEERDFEDFTYERNTARRVAGEFGGAVTTTSESGYGDGDETTYATYDVSRGEDGPPLNLIFVTDLYDALNAFPDELSQAFIDEAGHVNTSAGFDRIRMQVGQGREVYALTRLYPGDERLTRLSKKYPGLRWLAPDPSGSMFDKALERARIHAELEWV